MKNRRQAYRREVWALRRQARDGGTVQHHLEVDGLDKLELWIWTAEGAGASPVTFKPKAKPKPKAKVAPSSPPFPGPPKPKPKPRRRKKKVVRSSGVPLGWKPEVDAALRRADAETPTEAEDRRDKEARERYLARRSAIDQPKQQPKAKAKRKARAAAAGHARLKGCEEESLAALLERGPVRVELAESLWPADQGEDALDALATRGLVQEIGGTLVGGPRLAEAKQPRERKPKPAYMKDVRCWAECGSWRNPSKADVEAGWPDNWLRGPSASMWDSNGRRYRVAYAVDYGNRSKTSHNESTGEASSRYPKKLQPRDRGGALLRLQVEDLVRSFDPMRYLAPAYGPDTGTPVVLLNPRTESELRAESERQVVKGGKPGLPWKAPVVVAGNGRMMAQRRWAAVKPVAERLRSLERGQNAHEATWRAVALGRWKSGKLGSELSTDAWPIVRVLEAVVTDSSDRPVTMADAIKLAGASQVSPSADTTAVSGAVSEARGLGIASPLDVATWDWVRPLDRAGWPLFTRSAWFKAFLKRLSKAKRAAASSADTGPGKVENILLGTLPADALPPDAAPPGSLDALLGALPALWTLEQEQQRGHVESSWSLIPYLPAAWSWVVRAGTRGARRAIALAEDEADQTQAFEADAYSDHGVRPEGVALAVLLLRAAARRNPREAAAELFGPVVDAARAHPPGQATLVPTPPTGPRLLRLAGVRWAPAQDNPGRRGTPTVYGQAVTLTVERDSRGRTTVRGRGPRRGMTTRDGREQVFMPRWYGLAAVGSKTMAVDLQAVGPGSVEAWVSGARRASAVEAAAGPVWPARIAVEVLETPTTGDPERLLVTAVEYLTTSPGRVRRRHRVSGRVYYYPQTGAIEGLKNSRRSR